MVNLRRLLVFLLLSASDLSLTWYLLHHSEGRVYESNPVARWLLDSYGWMGMAALKGGTVLVAAGIALFLARRKPQLSEGILTAGCAILLCVVGYSAYLASVVRFNLDPDLATLDQERERNASIQRSSETLQVFRAQRNDLVVKLTREEITLPEAAHQLSQTEQLRDPGFLSGLVFSYGRRSTSEYMAICLLEGTLQEVDQDVPRMNYLAQRLVDQFHAAYFRDPPWSAKELVQYVREQRMQRAQRLHPLERQDG